MLTPLVEVSPDRDAMRRSVELAKVRKALLEFDWICDVTNDICDRYKIGMAGGPESAGG
jgi:hypothetical protein